MIKMGLTWEDVRAFMAKQTDYVLDLSEDNPDNKLQTQWYSTRFDGCQRIRSDTLRIWCQTDRNNENPVFYVQRWAEDDRDYEGALYRLESQFYLSEDWEGDLGYILGLPLEMVYKYREDQCSVNSARQTKP